MSREVPNKGNPVHHRNPLDAKEMNGNVRSLEQLIIN